MRGRVEGREGLPAGDRGTKIDRTLLDQRVRRMLGPLASRLKRHPDPADPREAVIRSEPAGQPGLEGCLREARRLVIVRHGRS